MKRAAYPKYKPSGVEYLGEVPAHWEVARLKNLCTKSALYGANVATNHYADAGVRYIRTTDITDDGTLKISGGVFLPEELAHDYLLEDGDILLSRSGTVGRSFLYNSKLHGLCAYAGYLVRFVPSSQALSQYLFQFTKTQSFSVFLRTMAISSTIDNVNAEKYANVFLPIPPLPEQTAITDFLNRETVKTDALVEKKQTLIARLKEKRGALITRAVTKGLNPDAPMKDSGVEYLGEVPAHWDVRRLRDTTDMRVSNVDKHIKEEETPVRLCNYVDVYKNDTINKQMDFMRATATDREIARFRLAEGDVLITKDSETWDDIGVPALVVDSAPDLVSGYHLALLRPCTERITGGYLFRTLQSSGLAHQFYVGAKGITRYGLTHAGIKSVWLPLPPLPEQTAITDFLNRETGKIDALIAKVEETIERLKEHRSALISAAVTGRIDVRAAK